MIASARTSKVEKPVDADPEGKQPRPDISDRDTQGHERLTLKQRQLYWRCIFVWQA